MSVVFVFEFPQVRHLLDGLRKVREASKDEKEIAEIDATICWMKHQIVGKIKHLEPFMRNRKWIEDEIVYENNKAGSSDFHDCEDVACKKPCRGKFCLDCWKGILAAMHGNKEHTAEECKNK